jgi:hypothetical protein
MVVVAAVATGTESGELKVLPMPLITQLWLAVGLTFVMLSKLKVPSALIPPLMLRFRSGPPVRVRAPVERTFTLPTVVVPAGSVGFAPAVSKQTLAPLVGGPRGVQLVGFAQVPAPLFQVNAPPGQVT